MRREINASCKLYQLAENWRSNIITSPPKYLPYVDIGYTTINNKWQIHPGKRKFLNFLPSFLCSPGIESPPLSPLPSLQSGKVYPPVSQILQFPPSSFLSHPSHVTAPRFLSPLPSKENKDYSRSWESKLSPSRLVCKGASGQARSIAIRLETELCALPLSLSILGERWMLVHSRSRRRSRKFPTAACTRPR